MLRQMLAERYRLKLPEAIDLAEVDLERFHAAIAAEIERSEPGVTLHLRTRPQIQLMRETARRRTDVWRRRSQATGRGLRSHLGVDFSYARTNYAPLGLQLYRQFVSPPDAFWERHLETADAAPHAPSPPTVPTTGDLELDEGETEDKTADTTQRQVYDYVEAAAGPYDWAVDLTHATLGNFDYRKMSLVRDYDRMMSGGDTAGHPAFDALFAEEAQSTARPPDAPEWLESALVVPADPSQAAAIAWARQGQSFIIQGPPGTGKSQTITNLIADFVARGKRVLFVCQKRAALDVVHHRLQQSGLDELAVLIHDTQDDKREFIAELRETYRDWASRMPDDWFERRLADETARLREATAGLERIRAQMLAPAAGSDASLLETALKRLELGAPPPLDEATVESLPTPAAWEAHRAGVLSLARAQREHGIDGTRRCGRLAGPPPRHRAFGQTGPGASCCGRAVRGPTRSARSRDRPVGWPRDTGCGGGRGRVRRAGTPRPASARRAARSRVARGRGTSARGRRRP